MELSRDMPNLARFGWSPLVVFSVSSVKGGPTMSEPIAKTIASTPDRSRTPPREQRRWIRYTPKTTRASLSWDEGSQRIRCDANLVDISGGGAALLCDRAPGPDEPLWLRLESGSTTMEDVEARSIAISDDPAGKRLVRLRFTSWVSLDSVLGQLEERRLWQRYPAREKRARLTWHEAGSQRTIQGELLNISGGGAAIITDAEPTPDAPAWLELATEAAVIDPVESKVLGISFDPSGQKFVRLTFVGTCPIEFFELVVHGSM